MSDTVKFHKHKSYNSKLRKWEYYKDFFEGDKERLVSSDYLIPHELETLPGKDSRKLREIREDRTEYTNYIEPFVLRFVSLIFKKEVDFSLVKEKLYKGDETEFNDVDGKGTPLDDFIKREIAEKYFLYGKVAVHVDSSKDTAETEQERIDKGIRPFIEAFDPQSIHDWEYEKASGDNISRVKFATHFYSLIEPRDSALDSPVESSYVKHFRKENGKYVCELYKQEDRSNQDIEPSYRLVDTINYNLDFIPLLILDNKSWIRNTIPKAKQLYNLDSVNDNIHLNQAHQRLIAIGQFNNIGAGDSKSFASSEGNLTVIDGEGTITVVQPADTASLERRREQIATEMIKVTFLQTRHLPAGAAGVESWQTIREAKEDFRAVAINAARDIESLVNQMLVAIGKFKGIEVEEDLVTFDKDITVEDVNETLQWMLAYRDRIARYPLWQKAVDEMGARRMNLDNLDEVLKQIKSGAIETFNDPIGSIFNGSENNRPEPQEPDTGA